MTEFDEENTNLENFDDSDKEMQEAFAKGYFEPGLYIEYNKIEKINNISKLLLKYDEIHLDLPWIERMDMINDLAPLAPELAIKLEKHEQKRENEFKGNAKIPYVRPELDPVLNDFKREMVFHRQAQSAVLEGIKKLHGLQIPTKRPDDYFAEMAKSDEHMQKVRKNLTAKQEGQAKSERIRQIREQRKMGKLLQKQTKVQREMEKKEMLEQLKKFRKGKLNNLDFLDDSKVLKNKKKLSKEKRKVKNERFGFGGKKRGSKWNTKESSMGIEKIKKKGKNKSTQRPGKTKRLKSKAKKRNQQ